MKLAIPITQATSSSPYLHILYFIFIFITACSVFKQRSFLQADSLQKQTTRREVKTKESAQADAVRIYNHQDSTVKRSFIEIFPEGLFNYSTKEGFTGIANRVVINERLTAGMKVRDSARLQARRNTVSSTMEGKRNLHQTRLQEKNVTAGDYTSWYLGGLLLIFAAVFVFRWKLND